MHINHCLSSAKAIPTQEIQKLLCVDAAASDAENRCTVCDASLALLMFFEKFFSKIFETTLQDLNR